MRPTIRQLEYFVAVADTLHFGEAARRCGVSQPGLSAQIKELEQTLGVELFERSRRTVLLAPAGDALLARARTVLRDVDDLVDTAAELTSPLEGRVRLGVIPTVAPYVLPHLLPQLRRLAPELRVELLEDKTDDLIETLARGGLDVLLLALPVDGAGLSSVPVFEDPFVLVTPAGHRLAKRGRVKQHELSDEPILLLDEGHCLRDHALEVCTAQHAIEEDGVRATSMNTLVQMVANGLGITLLPASSVAVEVGKNDALVVRRFAPPSPTRRIGLVWRSTSGRVQTFEKMAAALRSVAADIEDARIVRV